MPDPTLLTELMGLRQLTVNLFAAVAGSSISPDQVRDIVRQADHVKEGKARKSTKGQTLRSSIPWTGCRSATV